MTESQKAAITEYRMQSIGYKRISGLTGIPLSTVKSFCRKRNLTSSRFREFQPISVCLECGSEIIQIKGRKRKKFCCDECRRKWWNSHQELINRKAVYSFTCPACGNAFTAYGNAKRKYCSHECYIRDRFGGEWA